MTAAPAPVPPSNWQAGASWHASIAAPAAVLARDPPVATTTADATGEAASTSRPQERPSGGGGGGDPNEFHLRFGEAVEALRNDLPEMFQRDLQWHIYRDDITLTLGSLSGAHLSGIFKYKWLHRSLRALTWALYSDVRLATLRMWEPQVDRRQLRVRWCVMARPRLPFLMGGSGDEAMRFEAISTYKFDRHGAIYEHSVDRIIPPESPIAQWLHAFVGWHGVGAPAPQPGGVAMPVPGGGGPFRGEL